jgi:hypothetical protein
MLLPLFLPIIDAAAAATTAAAAKPMSWQAVDEVRRWMVSYGCGLAMLKRDAGWNRLSLGRLKLGGG